jgi:hypothetical protein
MLALLTPVILTREIEDILSHLSPVLHHLAEALSNQVVQLGLQLGVQAWVGG